MKPIIAFQAEDGNGGGDNGEADTPAAAASTRKNVSSRDFLAGGAVVDKMEEADGARYTLKGAKDGTFDLQVPAGTDPQVAMYAIFGFHTKIGNVANSVLNNKDNPGDADDAADAIREFMALVKEGNWTQPGKGPQGAKVDRDKLAGALVEAYADAGQTKDYATVRDWLEDAANVRKARKIPAVEEKYLAAMGKEKPGLEGLGV